MEDAFRWAGEHALELAGIAVALVVGVPTLWFAWQGWNRGRRLVEIRDLRTAEGKFHVKGQSVNDLFLEAQFKARRNRVFIADAVVAAGRTRIKGSPPQFTNRRTDVREGDSIGYQWRAAKLATLAPDKAWRVCWIDSEDKLHCEGGSVPPEMVKALAARGRPPDQ